jgi:hypothetical protein
VVIYDEQKNKTINKAGCDIIYRAYIDQDISIIESDGTTTCRVMLHRGIFFSG